jgi:hypothetical protein
MTLYPLRLQQVLLESALKEESLPLFENYPVLQALQLNPIIAP